MLNNLYLKTSLEQLSFILDITITFKSSLPIFMYQVMNLILDSNKIAFFFLVLNLLLRKNKHKTIKLICHTFFY